jgi:hypothetical protein
MTGEVDMAASAVQPSSPGDDAGVQRSASAIWDASTGAEVWTSSPAESSPLASSVVTFVASFTGSASSVSSCHPSEVSFTLASSVGAALAPSHAALQPPAASRSRLTNSEHPAETPVTPAAAATANHPRTVEA